VNMTFGMADVLSCWLQTSTGKICTIDLLKFTPVFNCLYKYKVRMHLGIATTRLHDDVSFIH